MRSIRRATALVIAIIMLLGLCACGKSGDTLDNVIREKTIVFGVAPDRMPISYETPDGDTAGVAVDIGNQLAQRLAVDAQFVFIEPENAVDALNNEEIDCYLCLPSSNIKTAAQMQTVDTGMDRRSAIAVLGGSGINRLLDIKGKRVCTVSGSDAAADLDAATVMRDSCAQVQYAASLDELMSALNDSACDAAVVDEALFCNVTRESGDKYRLLGQAVSSCDYVLAVRLRDTALSERLALLYGDMLSDGSVDGIKEKWLGR